MPYAEPAIPFGNPMEWEVTFTDVNGAPFDPNSGITIKLTRPVSGISTSYAYPADVSKKAVGVYAVTVTSSERGDWVGVGRGLLPDGTPITTAEVAQKVT